MGPDRLHAGGEAHGVVIGSIPAVHGVVSPQQGSPEDDGVVPDQQLASQRLGEGVDSDNASPAQAGIVRTLRCLGTQISRLVYGHLRRCPSPSAVALDSGDGWRGWTGTRERRIDMNEDKKNEVKSEWRNEQMKTRSRRNGTDEDKRKEK